MAQRVSIPANDYVEWLLPKHDATASAAAQDGLLPLVRRWFLSLLVKHNQVDQLATRSHMRRLLEVGNPAYWNGQEDDPIHFDDDTETGSEANERRSKRWAYVLLEAAQSKAMAQSLDYAHPVFVNIQILGDLLSLNAADRVVLCFLVLVRCFEPLESVVDNLHIQIGSPAELAGILALATGCTAEQVRRALTRNSALRSMGLVSLERDSTALERYAELQRGIGPLLMTPHDSADTLVQFLLTARKSTALTNQHFPHLADEIALLASLLGEAMRKKVSGTNILLYGPPGVGKTELASVLAQQLGASLYEVGYADEDGEPIRGTQRLSAYALCQRLLGQRTDALVLFDEVEDMLEDGETPGKAWVNRSLEENPVPAIWITNNERAMDPAYLRRFDYSVRVTTPPKEVRKQIAMHYLQEVAIENADLAGDGIADSWLESLAENASLTPSQIERAAKVARLMDAQSLEKGNHAQARKRVEQVLDRSTKLLRQPMPRTGRAMATAYDLAYLNTDVSISELVDSLRHSPMGSFCFYGPPGVGKTALAQHMAKELELPLVLRRASDLLDCYLGETEQNIAAMFAAAKAESSVLVLDEADSFLQSRSRAQHSWEITQVNELLTQMEDYEGIFICTTNLMAALDTASLRRFDWKIGFKSLTSSQRWALFLQEFHLLGGDLDAAMPLEKRVRRELESLAPGDFAPVTRQFRLLRQVPAPQEFLQRLRAELSVKNTRDGGGRTKDGSNERFMRMTSDAEAT